MLALRCHRNESSREDLSYVILFLSELTIGCDIKMIGENKLTFGSEYILFRSVQAASYRRTANLTYHSVTSCR